MASIPSSLSAGDGFLEALKKMYSPEKTRLRVELNNPTWAAIKKVPIGEGQSYTYSIGLTYGSGFGNSLSGIKTGGLSGGSVSSGAKVANVVVNTGNDYALLELDNKFLARAKKADAAFVEQLKYQVDASLKGMGLLLSSKLFGAGNGSICAATSSTTTVTLGSAANTRFFTPGMNVVLLDSSYVITSTVAASISSISESAGTLTLSANPTVGNACAYIGLAGVAGVATGASGFGAWIPSSAPSGTTVGNALISTSVNRSGYQSQLGGFRVDDTSRPIDECAYLLAQKIQERGGRPDRIVCSYNTFNKMAVKAWNKIVPMNKAEATATGVASLGLVTPHGTIPFVVDSSCPDDRCYMLTTDTWRIVHLSGALPERIGDAAGSGMMFQTSDDSVEIRYRAWWNLICLSPVDNGVFTVDSTNF